MTLWVLSGRDPTDVKLDIEDRLRREEENVANIENTVAASKQLTDGMVGILLSFEQRLKRLEGTILPVYQETENLQRRQENIDRTIEAMDHVIAFYNVSKEVEDTVAAGPNAVQLEHFLHTLSRLKCALDYFERNNPKSIEMENVRSLYEHGGDALSRQFAEVVKKHSKPVPAVDILNSISVDEDLVSNLSGPGPGSNVTNGSNSKTSTNLSDDFASIHHFPEEVQTDLIQIAEWLNLNDHDEFMNIYANVRGQVTKKSLDQLRDHQKSGSGGRRATGGGGGVSPGASRKFSSPMAGNAAGAAPVGTDGTPSGTKVSRFQSTITRRISSISTQVTGLKGRRSLIGPPGAGFASAEETVSDLEVESFCLSVSALQRLMTSEQVLMVGIVPHQYQRKIFEIVVRDSIELVLGDGDAIMAKVKKAIASNDFLSIMTVFYVIRHLMNVKPRMDRTMEGCDAAVRSKYNSMIGQFFTTGTMALDRFIDGIRSDSTTREKMPKDGTVFQLTSNVILFLEQLLDYVETIASILQQDSSYNQSLLRLPRKISVSDRSHALVGLYMEKVLVQLNYTLINKSETYGDQFLKAVFRLNNNQYILRALQRSDLLPVVCLANAECEDNYNQMILEQKKLYSQSWQRVIQFIWTDDIPTAILQAPGKLADKYCRMIKDKFAGFNKEMEDISSTQRSYSIPDVELRESLKRDNKEYILPKYSSFYDKYANIAFTKNPEKYVKYIPAQVSALIDCFFDAAA
jgi:exocyst complex protein 7